MNPILLVISKQSFVDVITNSSSELFICDTDKSLEFVESFLRKCLDLYNEGRGTEYNYEEAFGDIEVITDDNIEEFIGEYIIGWVSYVDDIEVPDYFDFTEQKRDMLGWIDNPKTEEDRQANSIVREHIEEAWEEYQTGWIASNLDTLQSKYVGNIIVSSKGENSIPYGLFDMIEESLNAQRIHLG